MLKNKNNKERKNVFYIYETDRQSETERQTTDRESVCERERRKRQERVKLVKSKNSLSLCLSVVCLPLSVCLIDVKKKVFYETLSIPCSYKFPRQAKCN